MADPFPLSVRLTEALDARLSGVAERRLPVAGDPAEVSRQRRSEITTEQALDLARHCLAENLELWKPDEVETLVQQLEDVAAVSGRFRPTALALDADDELRTLALSRLADACVADRRGESVWWLLGYRRRTTALTRLARAGRLHELLAGPLPETDPFGTILRELLRHGADVRIDERGRSELLDLVTAVEAIADAGLPHPDLAMVRERLTEHTVLDDYAAMVPEQFIGRRSELAALKAFLRRPGADQAGVVVTGLGGAGKSTLLAKFARDLTTRRKATVVVLDFDRPGVDARDALWLNLEVARQVGQQYPATAPLLRKARRAARVQRSHVMPSLDTSSSEHALSARAAGRLLVDVGDALNVVGARLRPFLLILDTFEEVTQQDLTTFVLKWLAQLDDILGQTPLRVVYSGRLFDVGLEQIPQWTRVRVVEVGEFSERAAAELLRSLDVPDALAKRLARSRVLPRRPLELKLLARLVADDPDASVELLEASFGKEGPAAQQMFAGLIYRRVLLRIADETARALAYPGLVLRFVTPELIQRVLVPALGLRPMDDRAAREALRILGTHEWLAYRATDVVWHRRDMRRSMLKVMMAAEPHRAQAVSREAIAYFDDAKSTAERAEGAYHRLLWLGHGDDYPSHALSELRSVAEHIGADITDLSPAGAALLRYATGRVGAADIPLLPRDVRLTAYHTAGASLVAGRALEQARQLAMSMRADAVVGPRLLFAEPVEWETEATYKTAAWPQLVRSRELPWGDGARYDAVNDLTFPLIVQAAWLGEHEFAMMIAKNAVWAAAATRLAAGGKLRESALSRAVMNAVLFKAYAPWRVGDDAGAGRVVTLLRKRRRFPLNVEWRLVSLERALAGGAGMDVLVAPSTVRLDYRWLRDEAVSQSAAELAAAMYLREVAGAIRHVEAEPDATRTVRRLLAAVDRVEQPSAEAETFSVPGRGPDPEFRDPARYALLDAYPDETGRRRLGALIRDRLSLQLADLEPRRFAEAVAADPERLLEDYVELVDRTWQLGPLLRDAHADRPTAEKLTHVYRAWERWDSALYHAHEGLA